MSVALLGLGFLVAVVLLLKWYADADVKTVRKSVRWIGVGFFVVIIVVLAATGRLGAAFGVLMALAAWAWRIFGMVQSARQFSGMFRSFGFGQGWGSGAASAAQSSEVDSVFLKMRLDLGNGQIEGQVTRGAFAGRALSTLSLSELMALLADVQGDVDSVGLLEAYMDRAHPTWRDNAGPQDHATPPPTGASMTNEEAHRILGLTPPATPDAVKAAYRRLMTQLHPDRGGSDYLAAKVNQAKDFLLKGSH